MAGLVFKLKFTAPGSKAFKSYIDYMDRDETKLKKEQMFSGFSDYMENPEKSTGLFTDHHDCLNKEEKYTLKNMFTSAQRKGSLLYQGVFSFQWSWLIENGLATEDHQVNEAAVREYTRKSLKALGAAEALQNWVWSGAIHYNTDHIHVHFAMADPNPSWQEGIGRCRRNSKNGELYQRGKIKDKSREKTRSTFINAVINAAPENQLINKIIRNQIIAGKRQQYLYESPNQELQQSLKALLDKLPEDMRLWNYNMSAMDGYRDEIDQISKLFIETYFKEEYMELKEALDSLSKKYANSYGDSKRGTDYAEEKEKDLYYRLGNSILSECRNVRKAQRKARLDYLHKEPNGNLKLNGKSETAIFSKAIYNLKKALHKDIESIKNQAAYERLQKENEITKQ